MPNSTLPSSIKKTSSFVAGSPLPFYYRFISSAIREIYFSKISLIYPSRSQAENTHPKLILCSHRNSAFDGYVALKALGERLVIRSVLDCPMDIYFANEKPLADAILADNPTEWNQLRHHIYQNKAGYLKAKSVTPQWIYGEDSCNALNTNEHQLKGLAGSAGIVEGEVYLVYGSENFA